MVLKVSSYHIELLANLVQWPYNGVLSARADDKQLV